MRFFPIAPLIVLLAALLVPLPATAQDPAATAVPVSVFWKPGCPYCVRAKTYLAALAASDDSLRIEYLDISGSVEARLSFVRASDFFGYDPPGVPLIVIGGQSILGYDSDETTGKEILAAVRDCRRGPCPALAALLAGNATGAEPAGAPKPPPATVSVPLVGEVDLSTYSLPALTIVLAAIDGFNPCAMWILVFLIGLLVGMQDRLRMWILGGAFLLTSGLVYFGFLAAWLNLFLMLGAIVWVRLAVGAVALASGAYYLRDFVKNTAAECAVTSPQQRLRIIHALKASVGEKRFLLALAGIMVLAAAVNLVEFFCSAGIPAVFTQVLAVNDLPAWQHYALIGLYVVVFMLDDAAIFVLAMFTLAATGMTTRYLRFSHLAGGIVMTAIGVLLLFAPDWLAFAG